MNPVMRVCLEEDREKIYEIYRDSFQRYVEPRRGWDELNERKRFSEWFCRNDTQVVQVNGVDVGFVQVQQLSDRIFLHWLLVLPEKQSGGVGKYVLEHVKKRASQLSLPVYLEVLKINPRARIFYEKNGFVYTKSTTTHDCLEWIGF